MCRPFGNACKKRSRRRLECRRDEQWTPELPLLRVNFDPALVRLLREVRSFEVALYGPWAVAQEGR